MLCAHEPTMDPRVRWTAQSAAGDFDVVVLGFNRDDQLSASFETTDGYRILRLVRISMSPLIYFWHMKRYLPIPLLLASVLVGVISVVVLAWERVVRWSLALWAATKRHISRGARHLSNEPRTDSLAVPNESANAEQRQRLRTRFSYIIWLLRMQFAPATSLFWSYIKETPVRPDVVHCNDLDTLLVGVLAKRHFGCRLVYDAHEYYPYSDPYGRWLDIRFFAAVERSLIRHADAVVTVNPMLAEIMSKAYGIPRIYSVPNAEPVAATPVKTFTSPMSALAGGRLKCIFQGRYAPKRGNEEIIRAWQHVDGSRAALFLRGPSNIYAEEAKALAERLGLLDKSVYFLAPVSEDLLVSAAAEADIGLVPYLPEFLMYQYSCPNKLSQYMHAGLMIVTNELPYVRSVVEEADAGLVYSSNSLETLGRIIDQVANDPRLLAKFKSHALRYAHERFNWQAYFGIFESLYLGNDPAGAAGHSAPDFRRG
jgi:glycosyltransferase involved in cell wall biosynthesis